MRVLTARPFPPGIALPSIVATALLATESRAWKRLRYIRIRYECLHEPPQRPCVLIQPGPRQCPHGGKYAGEESATGYQSEAFDKSRNGNREPDETYGPTSGIEPKRPASDLFDGFSSVVYKVFGIRHWGDICLATPCPR